MKLSFKDTAIVACGTMSLELNHLKEQGIHVARIEATHCMGMLAADNELGRIRQEVAGGEPVWFMTPGWVKYRTKVFKGWDKGMVNGEICK